MVAAEKEQRWPIKRPLGAERSALTMRSFNNQDFEITGKPEDFRLETPRMAGYRAGMTSSSVIGRKLGHMYDLPSDIPRKIGDLIQAIDRKIIR